MFSWQDSHDSRQKSPNSRISQIAFHKLWEDSKTQMTVKHRGREMQESEREGEWRRKDSEAAPAFPRFVFKCLHHFVWYFGLLRTEGMAERHSLQSWVWAAGTMGASLQLSRLSLSERTLQLWTLATWRPEKMREGKEGVRYVKKN